MSKRDEENKSLSEVQFMSLHGLETMMGAIGAVYDLHVLDLYTYSPEEDRQDAISRLKKLGRRFFYKPILERAQNIADFQYNDWLTLQHIEYEIIPHGDDLIIIGHGEYDAPSITLYRDNGMGAQLSPSEFYNYLVYNHLSGEQEWR